MGEQHSTDNDRGDGDEPVRPAAPAPVVAPVVLPAGVFTMPPVDLGGAGVNGTHAEAPPAVPPRSGRASEAAADAPPTDAATTADGLVHILARQWPVLAATTALMLLLGVAYLLLARPIYTASATLRVDPMDPQSLTGSAAGNGQLPEDYLDTECVVIKSDAVLALALDNVRNTRTLAASPHPLDALKAGLDATVAKKGKAIDVSFESHYPREAEQVVGAVVDAYRAYNTNYWATRGKTLLETIQSGSKSEEDELAEKQQRMMELARSSGGAIDADPDKTPAHLAVVSLRDESYKANLDAIAARTAYQEMANSILGDPAKVAAVERATRSATFSTDPQAQLKTIQTELFAQQARLTDARQQYMEGHPIVRQIESRIDQLTVAAVVAAKQWQDVAEGNQQALAHSLADAQRAELETEQNQVEYARLQADVKRLRAMGDEVDSRIHNYQLTNGAGAVSISVLDDPHVDLNHVRPGRTKTLAVAALVGLLAGAGLACVRDFSDDRFRTLDAIRVAAGAPVLGAIPAIPASVAASAADRGQVVHFDPFGDASESYRTLRTALQFGMPARTKTLLVTSPIAGDGKSTLVSNLAIALAQANRRVLVIDADLRAPVQHRLFGLSDRTGLASVLDGSDTLDHAIHQTGIPGLDVLPAGPIPSNPAEMLNTPDFGDHINDLADRYDMVLIDSPPVTAVTDARILAASADASLLVVRLGTSTRRQTEAARDGLRGVGARLVGVAVNGVGRRGELASATGYYARPETAPAPVNLAIPSSSAPGGGRLGHDPLSDAVRTAPPAARR